MRCIFMQYTLDIIATFTSTLQKADEKAAGRMLLGIKPPKSLVLAAA